MRKTTYVATAPDGTEHTRKTDRTYTHAILLEGDEGWSAVGFCGRLDLAEKKQTAHPGSIVVECGVFGNRAADTHEPEATEKSVDQNIREAKVYGPAPRQTIGQLVQELLMDEALGYEAIVELVKAEFPDARTSVRSVASVAAVLRKKGVQVPMRRRTKG